VKVIVENLSDGIHNADLDAARGRLVRGNTYKDLSTVIVVPTRGMIHAKVVQSWMGLMLPMNQKATRVFVIGMEVGEAYNYAVNLILNHPELSTWKYMLTLEEDNLPPPNGLLRLYESIEEYVAVGGLYWTKGEAGQPMCYGQPGGILNFIPQVPQLDTVQECNGLGMGFTLFQLDLFRKLDSPWFKTEQSWSPQQGGRQYTQDLWHFERVRRAGLRVACDTRVRVGHYDVGADIVW
jgi:hypothetical protein